MKDFKFFLIIIVVLLFFSGCSKDKDKAPALSPGLYAQIETNVGVFIIQLEYEKVPMLVANFIGLAEGIFESAMSEEPDKVKSYDGSIFNEVAKDVLVKGGSLPSGRSIPPYEIPNNFHPDLMHDQDGAISMAQTSTGIHSNEFTITLKKAPWLDYKEPVFGYVVIGMNKLRAIRRGDTIKTIKILRIGSEAAGFTVTMESFTQLQKEVEAKNKEEERSRTEDVIGTLKETWPNLTQTQEGIWFTILKQGVGTTPAEGTEILVKYVGTLQDGTVFMDTAGEEGGMKKMVIGNIIKGLDGALQAMRKGEHRIVIIPPELGFGEAGLAPLIPPNSFLIFDVELIDF